MKTNDLLIIGAVGLAAYFLFKKDGLVSGSSDLGVTATGSPTLAGSKVAETLQQSGKASTTNEGYTSAIQTFVNTPINTTASIKAGIDVINQAVSTGTQLPRLSETLYNVGYNSNVARLADGSTKVVTVTSKTPSSPVSQKIISQSNQSSVKWNG